MFLLAAAGCASHSPRPLAIESPSTPQQPTAVARGTINLKVVTFNVWGLPSWINGASTERFDRIAGELKSLHPDFAVLQEVWSRNAKKCIPTNDHMWIARAAQSHSVFRRTGLVTLSLHPIVGGQFHPFRNVGLPDAIVSKGALKTTIELESGVRLNLWNLHLQAGETARAAKIRCRQIEELAAWVRNAEDGQIADVVAGDFNCEPGSLPYQRLQETIGAGALELGGCNAFCTYDGMKPNGREHLKLDHVLIRPRQPMKSLSANPEVAFTAASRRDRLSDHFGVKVGLSMVPVTRVPDREQPGLLAIRRVGQDESQPTAIPTASYPVASPE